MLHFLSLFYLYAEIDVSGDLQIYFNEIPDEIIEKLVIVYCRLN